MSEDFYQRTEALRQRQRKIRVIILVLVIVIIPILFCRGIWLLASLEAERTNKAYGTNFDAVDVLLGVNEKVRSLK